MSVVEATSNVVVGYGLPMLTQILVFPIFKVRTTLAQNMALGVIFTVVSVARATCYAGCSKACARNPTTREQRGGRASLSSDLCLDLRGTILRLAVRKGKLAGLDRQ
jgi:hypothetical protein